MGEPRYRLPGAGKLQIMPDFCRDIESSRKAYKYSVRRKLEPLLYKGKERLLSCRFFTLKLTLFSLLLAASFTFLLSPTSYQELRRTFKSSFTESINSKERYNTQIPITWAEIASLLGSLKVNNAEELKVGLVNFNKREEVKEWEEFVGQRHSFLFPFEHMHEDVQWADLYPEWIDEEEQDGVPKCPYMPMPNVKQGTRLDLVVVKVPCRGSWSRDVARLQVELAGAHVALYTDASHLLVLDSCTPLPNLFGCSNLVVKAANAWLFKMDLPMLKKKLALPVGSCELAVPLEDDSRIVNKDIGSQEAYATILHSAQFYVCGAITVAKSIRLTGSTRDLVILVDENILPEHRKGLELAGWKVIEIQRIRNPKAEPEAYNEWNYSKFRLWQLTMYKRIIFIDADLLILRNIDFLFELPEISATGNNATLFNSGVMVIEPSNCTFQLLIDRINDIVSYNGGDQGYLNEIFTWWHRIPRRMNFLKHFWLNDTAEFNEKTRLFGADPPELYVLHYLGLKPWLCFRDYDCNWNVQDQRSFASDTAHALWWKVHDSMSLDLQQFCLLRTKQKAALEWDRLGAKNASFSDEHWKRNITDPRLQICNQDFCYWESMLWHWGDPNYDGNNPPVENATVSLL
ncbi:hypothetical protein GOP47_0018469 [Adiantum capillus-veneris]|uniref:Hexosyltransferase n=1 Tax=Adiantum capillus-veneris TaxID=13818 RepID=A0A9D4Z9L4_ADICA|nr:hypothetical protein GOP47_0018469 [Adiantum capillus-veneris]